MNIFKLIEGELIYINLKNDKPVWQDLFGQKSSYLFIYRLFIAAYFNQCYF